jgi:hypothetical protein
MIDYICSTHEKIGPEGPLVTTIDGLWAYCITGTDDGHAWQRIATTHVAILRAGLYPPAAALSEAAGGED